MSSTVRSLSFFLLAALATAAAQAIPPPWTPLGPYGGDVRTLTVDPRQPATLFAVTAGGAFKTIDRGASWSPIDLREDAGNVAADPAHPGVLYLSVRIEGVIKSTDGGAHWAPANGGLPFQNETPRTVAVDPARPERLYLITSPSGLWRSANAGASWRSAGPADARSIAVSPVAGTAFLSAAGGVYRTVDAGATWKPLSHGLPAGPADALAVSASDPRTVYAYFNTTGLFRSQDGGASWQRQAAALNAGDLVAFAVSPRTPRLLYLALSNGGFYRSADGGANWTGLTGISDVRALAGAEPRTSGTVYAGTGLIGGTLGGVWRSEDAGTIWTRRSQGLFALLAGTVAVDPARPDRLWTTLYGTAYRSLDRGAHWSARTPIPTDGGTYVNFFQRLVFGSSPRLYAQAARFRAVGGAHDRTLLWRTDDDAASWALLPSASAPLDVGLFDVAPSAPSHLYAVTVDDNGPSTRAVYRSTDGGDSWEARTNAFLDCGVGDLAVAPSDPDVLYVGGSAPGLFRCKPPVKARVLRSGDGGATWTDVSIGLPQETATSIAVDPRDPDVVYVGIGPVYTLPTGDGVWKSTDGGQTWSPAGTELANHTASALLASTLPGRLYAVVDGNRVVRSDDGGASWQGWSRGLHDITIFRLIADPSDPGRLYAATANGVWTLKETD